MTDATQKIVMIAGSGRSGSTLLSQLLGEIDGWFAAGELKYLWDAGFGRNQHCACGTPLRECEFWSEILATATNGDTVSIADYARLRDQAGSRARILRLMYPWLRTENFESALTAYAARLASFARVVAQVSGASVIVDASKDPAHALVYRHAGNVDLRVVHLVRDPRAVAHSKSRHKRKTAIKTHEEFMPRDSVTMSSIKWNSINFASWFALRKGNPYLQIDYDDLASDPAGAIRRVIRFAEEPEPGLSFVDGEQVTLSPSHTALGNPSRSSGGTMRVRPDDSWKKEMSAVRQALVTGLTWPVARCIGTKGDR